MMPSTGRLASIASVIIFGSAAYASSGTFCASTDRHLRRDRWIYTFQPDDAFLAAPSPVPANCSLADDLHPLGLQFASMANLDSLREIAADRDAWKVIVRRASEKD